MPLLDQRKVFGTRIKIRWEGQLVDSPIYNLFRRLKSNSALKSNEGHNLLKTVFAQWNPIFLGLSPSSSLLRKFLWDNFFPYLTPKCFSLFCLLASRTELIVSNKDRQIFDTVWGGCFFTTSVILLLPYLLCFQGCHPVTSLATGKGCVLRHCA